ncbi:cytochrome P450 [Mycena albidolilacea]|uniref:Cytochrome P450 n=1 Tax=Mycena albidolilacea TaxID=1033008 RepID=A0AAD7A8L1_9AGAR|nr:cytochrome P450 [Mycena albidolilacea]
MLVLISAISLAACTFYLARNVIFAGDRIPGPRRLPLLGNTLQLPKGHFWTWFERLYHEFGPIVSLNFAGDDYLLLSHPADAEELLVKRSAIFSGRKQSVFGAKYRSNNKRMLLLPHGEDLKKQRSVFKLLLRPNALLSYHDRIEQQSSRLLLDLLEGPDRYRDHLYRFTATLIMRITYGTGLHGQESDLDAILASNQSFNLDALPGAHLVDTFTWLDYLPDFLSPWRNDAKRKHLEELELFQRLAVQVKERRANGDDSESFMAQVWDCQTKYDLDEETVAYLGGSAFEAGTSVTACLLHTFLLACLTQPDVVRKAQAELDQVVGEDVPGFEHMSRLPYMHAVVKEALRWVPVTPLAFPHKCDVDQEYKGIKITAGTFIIPSIWNMHKDPRNFTDGQIFDPSRWYNPDANGNVKESDSLVDGHWTFGFGRRQCPANYLAVEVVWAAIAALLWAFDIRNSKDPVTGQPIEVDPTTTPWLDGVNIEPAPFPVSILPRTKAHGEKIRLHWKAVASSA